MSPAAGALKEKLFKLASRSRPLHQNPLVVMPESIAPIQSELLFSADEKCRRILELGAGWGEFAFEWLKKFPEDNYVAMEIKGDRILKFIKKINTLPPVTLRIIPINFNWFLEEILPPASFDKIIINFPDPWPKKKHWKHRLIQPDFPERTSQLLRPDGRLFMATDYGPYARRVLGIMRRSDIFQPIYPWPHYRRTAPADHPPTRFETIHEADGKKSYYQEWRLITD